MPAPVSFAENHNWHPSVLTIQPVSLEETHAFLIYFLTQFCRMFVIYLMKKVGLRMH